MRVMLTGIFFASLSACLGGITFVFTRIVIPQTDPATLSFLRYGLIGLILFAFSAKAVLKISMPKQDFIGVTIIGLGMFAVFPFFMAFGLSYTTASRGGLLYATMPLATITIASLCKIEQFTLPKLLSVILAIVGVIVAIGANLFPGNLDMLKGDALVMVGVLGAAVFTVFSGKYMAIYGNLPVMVFSAISGVSATFILSLTIGAPLNGSLSFDVYGWFAIFMLAVPGGALMMYSWGRALMIISPTQAAILLGFNPLTAMLLGALLIGEEITLEFIVGFLMVVSAVVLSNASIKSK
jgi:drug/metabolite transporter (DMT)-like permease